MFRCILARKKAHSFICHAVLEPISPILAAVGPLANGKWQMGTVERIL
jgi:hypothetical protein